MAMEAHITHIELEKCNRGCSHCASAAHPRLEAPELDELGKWLEAVPPDKKVVITGGEPFFYQDPNGKCGLGGLLRMLLEHRQIQNLMVVSSGIRATSSRERAAEQNIASLGKRELKRLQMVVSASNFPRVNKNPEKKIKAAREMQKRLLRLCVQNGIEVEIISFLGKTVLRDELVLPVIGESDNFPEEKLGINYRNKPAILGRQIASVGKEGGEYTDLGITYGCMARGENLDLGVAPDGAVIPGKCYSFVSSFVEIANIRKEGAEEIREKARLFRKRLREKFRIGKSGGKEPSCLRCLELAPNLRQPERCKAVVGKNNFKKVLKNRK
ncbi:MAG: radical SAM/SPASM domain-containing protein [Candidatus Micrarchaeia archaeon]